MREYDAVMFLGNGLHSDYQVKRIMARLRNAFTDLSYAQQGAKLDPAEHEDLVKDIAAALLGRDIVLGEQLPYPGKIKREFHGPSDPHDHRSRDQVFVKVVGQD